MAAESTHPRLDPFKFTSGRWLYRDQEERNKRYLKFDFDALRQRAVQACEGATSITSYEKFEGSSNRVFVFNTDNNKRVVAKVAFKLGSPNRLRGYSEVATVKYVKKYTSIPTPTILAHSGDGSNAVGADFVIQEHAKGVRLSEKWPSMTLDQKVKCIQTIHQQFKTLVDLDFPAYGNIYEASYAEEAGLQSVPIDEHFVVGPDCDGLYWKNGARSEGEKPIDQFEPVNAGPWESFEGYCNGAIDASIASVPAENSDSYTSQARVSWHGSPAKHISLLETIRKVMKTASRDPKAERILDVSKPVLMPYLPKRHIFVSESDPTIITDVIDFQGTGPEAPFLHASLILTFLEPNHSQSEPPNPEEDILMQTWMQATQEHTPRLMASTIMSQVFFCPIATCDTIWTNGAASMQQALQELREKWDTLNLESPCPIPALSEDEAKQLYADKVKSKAALAMRMTLTSSMKCRYDLFVPMQEWISTVVPLMMVWSSFRESLNAMEVENGVMMSADDVRLTWPFDIPMQMGEDLVLIAPRFMSTAIPGLFSDDKEDAPQAPKKSVKEVKKKEKGESKGLFKGLKKRFS